MIHPRLNRALWVGLSLLVVLLAFNARDTFENVFARVGTFDVRDDGGGTVYMSWHGEIAAPMASRIRETFEAKKDKAKTFVLALSSPGGSLDHGGKVIRLLRQIRETHRLDTVVEARRYCASMCGPVFLQGEKRRAAHSARFMFHEVAWFDALSREKSDVPVSATERETRRLFLRYFEDAGLAPAWVANIQRDIAGGHEVWKTGAELMSEKSALLDEIF